MKVQARKCRERENEREREREREMEGRKIISRKRTKAILFICEKKYNKKMVR